jgi:crossover junction endodeoxyribonuclease RuvC
VKVCGLDLSLLATGAVSIDTALGRTVARTIKTGTRSRGERLDFILETIVDVTMGADLAVIEGPSFMSKSSSADLIYELHGIVKHTLWRRRIPYAVCPPAACKLYTTGHGNADKKMMMTAMREAFPRVPIADDNQADAFALAAMGCLWKNQTVDGHVLRWVHELDKVEWPDHTGQAERKIRSKKPPVPKHKL